MTADIMTQERVDSASVHYKTLSRHIGVLYKYQQLMRMQEWRRGACLGVVDLQLQLTTSVTLKARQNDEYNDVDDDDQC